MADIPQRHQNPKQKPLPQPSTPTWTDRESSPETSRIDLNTATSEQLQTLPRIGPATAKRIIEYRETYRRFETVEDLTHVKGIGQKTLERIRHLVVVY